MRHRFFCYCTGTEEVTTSTLVILLMLRQLWVIAITKLLTFSLDYEMSFGATWVVLTNKIPLTPSVFRILYILKCVISTSVQDCWQLTGLDPVKCPSELSHRGCLRSGSPCWGISPAPWTASRPHTCRACSARGPRWSIRPLPSWGYVWCWTSPSRWGWCCSPAQSRGKTDL